MTVFQMAVVGPIFGTGKQALREINAGDVNVRVALREAAGVEAGTTGDFKKVGIRAGPSAGPKGVGDGGGVIAEQMLIAQSQYERL